MSNYRLEDDLVANYDYAVAKYTHFANLKKQFLNKEITSRKIVGTGYKNGKQVALDYLNGQLADWYEAHIRAYEALPTHLRNEE